MPASASVRGTSATLVGNGIMAAYEAKADIARRIFRDRPCSKGADRELL
jgi:hypothetical protein